MKTFGAALAAILIALAAAGGAEAQKVPKVQAPPGEPMTSEQLRTFHEGRELAGCYAPNNTDDIWRERMDADGRLFDLEKGGMEVGTWWVEEGGVICFYYVDRPPGPYCFTGRMRGPYYDFYSAIDGGFVGTTDCGPEPVA